MNRSNLARILGRAGGKSRARRLSAQRRSEIAAQGGRARVLSRWAARRVAENFRYLKAMLVLQRVSDVAVETNHHQSLPRPYVCV